MRNKKKSKEIIRDKLESIVLAGEARCERMDKPISINRYLYCKCWMDKGANLYCQYFNQKGREK